MVAQNPNMLQPILQGLAQQNPALVTALNQNPGLLMQLLGGEGGEGEGEEWEGEGGALPPGAHAINVTQEEMAAIERVCLPILCIL
jgi:UV excision repair protein RAD23